MKNKIVFLVIALVIVLMQAFRPNLKLEELEPENDFLAVTEANSDISKLIKGACYDCHSHDYTLPWYAELSPFSWIIANHIKSGIEELNFSAWSAYSADSKTHLLEEIVEVVDEEVMPLNSYKWMHAEGRLSTSEKEQIIDYCNSVNVE